MTVNYFRHYEISAPNVENVEVPLVDVTLMPFLSANVYPAFIVTVEFAGIVLSNAIKLLLVVLTEVVGFPYPILLQLPSDVKVRNVQVIPSVEVAAEPEATATKVLLP